MVKSVRQITFRIPVELWQEFSIKAIKDGKAKSRLLIEFIKKYLGKRD